MTAQPGTPPAPRRHVLIAALLIVGLGLIVFFGARAAHDFARFQQARHVPTLVDVEDIRGWMTLPYIARAYRVPERVLFAALDIPEAGNQHLSVQQLAKKYGRDSLETRRALQQAILRYQRTPTPGSGGAP